MIVFAKFLLGFFALVIIGLWIATFIISRNIESQFPPIGEFKTINSAKFHFVDTGNKKQTDQPPVIFIHGASGNLNDPLPVYSELLAEEMRLIFIDRPGQGYSEPFDGSNDPVAQASSIAGLMDELKIEKAVVLGHSWGGAVASSFGVLYPEKTAGLVLVSPVTHPWPGADVSWHFDVGNLPVIGWIFSNTLATPAGRLIYPGAIGRVFAPQKTPDDYQDTSATLLALRPSNFHENAKDVARVYDHVTRFQHRYKEITAPVHIYHGDVDDIVYAKVHSIDGLSKDIEGSKLTILEGVGHKPDYVARDQIAASIRELVGIKTEQDLASQ